MSNAPMFNIDILNQSQYLTPEEEFLCAAFVRDIDPSTDAPPLVKTIIAIFFRFIAYFQHCATGVIQPHKGYVTSTNAGFNIRNINVCPPSVIGQRYSYFIQLSQTSQVGILDVTQQINLTSMVSDLTVDFYAFSSGLVYGAQLPPTQFLTFGSNDIFIIVLCLKTHTVTAIINGKIEESFPIARNKKWAFFCSLGTPSDRVRIAALQ